MPMQRNRSPQDDLISEPVVAAQRDFPKAVVQNGQTGRNLNRPFAAGLSNVSHAGQSCRTFLMAK